MAARLGLHSSHHISSHHKSSHHVAFPRSYSDIPVSSLPLNILLFPSLSPPLLQPGTPSYDCLIRFNASISFQRCHFLILPLHCSLSEPLPLSSSDSPFFSHLISSVFLSATSPPLLFVQLFLILLSFPFPPLCHPAYSPFLSLSRFCVFLSSLFFFGFSLSCFLQPVLSSHQAN